MTIYNLVGAKSTKGNRNDKEIDEWVAFHILMHNRFLLSFYMKTYAYLWLSHSPYIIMVRSIPSRTNCLEGLIILWLTAVFHDDLFINTLCRRECFCELREAVYTCSWISHACISRLTKKVSTCTCFREIHVNKVNAGCGWKNSTYVFRQCGRLKCIRLCLSNIKTVRRKIVYCVSFKIMGNARGHIVLPLFCQDTF